MMAALTGFLSFTGIIRIGLDPVLVHLGPLSIHWYGLMYVVGIVAGLGVTLPYAEKLGISRDAAYGIFWPVLIASLVGGRLYFVVQSNLGWYLQHPGNILATWEGGMAFYGAVFLGAVAGWAAARWQHVSFPRVLDAAAVFIPLAQAFGRIGNIVNGDIIGYRSTLPWATQYTNPNNTFVPSHSIAYQPAAAYELLFSLALFILIWRLRFHFRVPGTLFALWLVLYSVGQFALFFGRANIIVLLGLKQAQLTAIVVVVATVPLWLLWRHVYLGTHGTEISGTYAPQTPVPQESA
jgi:phosphatidylglycerol---prolipoprotein diacylglyceryl transferase